MLEEAAPALAVALKQNAFTKAYLLGYCRLPKHSLDSYVPGSKEEAACFAGDLQLAWNAHPAANKWLASGTGKS
jgi:hypothetical protein